MGRTFQECQAKGRTESTEMVYCFIVCTSIWPSNDLPRTPNEREKEREIHSLVTSLIGVLEIGYLDFLQLNSL